ncbi:MAG: GTP-binding protein [Candidatus Thorarchaeota archaeon]
MNTSSSIQEILDDFIKEVPDLNAVLVIDFNGFIIAKKSIKTFDGELIGGIMSLLDQTLNRIKGFTQTELGSGSFDIDQFRLFYIQLAKSTGALLVLIGTPYSHLDMYIPYAHIIADKISLILSEFNVSCKFPSLTEKGDLKLKKNSRNIIITGPAAVGKTSFAIRCCNDSFVENYQTTIGVSIIEKETINRNGEPITLNLFDLSSLKSFAKVRRFFYNYSDFVIIMFDYSRPETLDSIEKWIDEARQFIDDTQVPFILVGNKIDLLENRESLKSKAIKITNQYNYELFETSILSKKGFEELFEYLKETFVTYDEKIVATPITSDFIRKLTEDERIVFISNIDTLDESKIPNLIEKNILKNIIKHKEISLAVLLPKMAPLEKALNRTIDKGTILKIVEKYIERGQIKKQYLKFDKEVESLDKNKMSQRGDI